MSDSLFDLSDEYEEMLNRGIQLSGENREFFVRGRVASVRTRLPPTFPVLRILDFGCGVGITADHLAQQFPQAEVYGVDTSTSAVEHATKTYGSQRVRFGSLSSLADERHKFDLCYVNGVFHHIVPAQRAGALAVIHDALSPRGLLALFENNPWNPGTRLVMARIPFDRDAQTLSVRVARRMLRKAALAPLQTWSLFYFPRSLGFLRGLERTLSVFPLGAQYCVLAEKR